MARTPKLTASEADGVQYRRAATWQIALAQLNNGSAMIFYTLIGLLSYLQNAGYGIAVAVAGIILTATRLLDGVIDPLLAMVIDKVTFSFGKLRFFLVVGWLIRIFAILMLFVWAPDKGFGAPFFIAMYALYIVGSSTNDIAGNMMGPVMTNDPRQRPMVGVWGTIYSYLVPTIFSLISTVLILPRHGNQFTVGMLKETAIVFVICSFFFQLLAVIGISPADKPENFRHIEHNDEGVSVGDMLRFVRDNRAFLRYTVAAASDKVAQQIGAQAVVTTMLYGILLGNIQLATILSVGSMLPSIIFAIFGARYAGKHGSKKAFVTWTWACLAIGTAALALCFAIDMRSILKSLPLMILFFGLQLVLNGSKMCVTTAAGAMRADIVDHELDRSGKYLPGVVTATYNFIDQIVSSSSAAIALGAVALIGYTTVMPQPTDAPNGAILVTALFLFFGVQIIGWVASLFAMAGYKLTREEMIAVQKRVADKKVKIADDLEGVTTQVAI